MQMLHVMVHGSVLVHSGSAGASDDCLTVWFLMESCGLLHVGLVEDSSSLLK